MADRVGRTAYDLIATAAQEYSERSLGTFGDTRITYGEAWNQAGSLANAFRQRGVQRGDRIGTIIPNTLAFFIFSMSCLRGGFVHVPINEMLSDEEIRHILTDSGAKALVVDKNSRDVIGKPRLAISELEVAIDIDQDSPSECVAFHDAIDRTPEIVSNADIQYSDPLRISYTGGTTGKPKGAVQTHGAIGTMMITMALEFEIRHQEEMLLMTPLTHGAGYCYLAGVIQGAHFTLTDGFDVSQFLSLVDSRAISWTFMVPTMLYRLIDRSEESLKCTDLSDLQTIVYGGAPISPERIPEVVRAFGNVFIQSYGQTETSGLGTILPKTDHSIESDKTHTVGQPVIGADIRVIDKVDRFDMESLPTGEPGEIALQAPFIFDHYHELPEETDETIIDGWVRTGDIGKFDKDGYLHLFDRKSDMIITGGMNVYSAEVEKVLNQHKKVRQVAVIGIPDDDWGEAVHAIVIPKGDEVSKAEINQFAADHLADYKKPKTIEFADRLPTTPYGKIDKVALRQPYWNEHKRQIN